MKDYKGKKLVLFFYPQDNTPTCTVEACNVRDNEMVLKKAGYEMVGVIIRGITIRLNLLPSVVREVV